MELGTQQKELLEVLGYLEQEYSGLWTDKVISRQLVNFKEDIENNFFTIVVLGEFKRGKSTFINALLKEKLLPADVTPTTATINALMYDEQKRVFIVDNDDKRLEGKADYDFLNQYVAESERNTDGIKYIKIGVPAPILNPNIILVDTPGVSDINEQRVQVTYDFIPRADVVLFLLDATSPVKRTEKEFIEEHLIKVGLDQILFIANKIDYIDEEEELDVLEDIENRLKKCFKADDKLARIQVLPVSSSMALEGALKQDEGVREASGIGEVEEAIKHIIEYGHTVEQREKRYRMKLEGILELIESDLKSQYNMAKLDEEQLQAILRQIEKLQAKDGERRKTLNLYIQRQKEDLLAMTQKSLYFFRDNLTEEMLEMIQLYKGTDFKEFVEIQLANTIKKNMQRWVNTHAVSIEKVLGQLGQTIATGLSNHFKQKVALNNQYLYTSEQNILQSPIVIEADDISHVTTQAGIISASMAGVIMLIGGSMVMPFISMAAFPFLQKKMAEGKLKEAKINVKPELTAAINKSIKSLYEEIGRNMIQRIDQLQIVSEQRYDELVDKYRSMLEGQMHAKSADRQGVINDMKVLESKLDILNEIKQGGK